MKFTFEMGDIGAGRMVTRDGKLAQIVHVQNLETGYRYEGGAHPKPPLGGHALYDVNSCRVFTEVMPAFQLAEFLNERGFEPWLMSNSAGYRTSNSGLQDCEPCKAP